MADRDANIDQLREELAYYRELSEELSAKTLQQDRALSKLRYQLKQKRRSFSVLAELQQSVRLDTPLDEIFETTTQSVNRTLGMNKTLILGPADQENCFEPLFWHGFEAGAEDHLVDTELWLPWRKACNDGHLVVNGSTSSTPFISSIRATFKLPYFVCIPILAQEEFIGLLVTGRVVENSPYYDRLNEEDVNTLKAIVGLITVAVRDQKIAALKAENERKEAELQKAEELEEAYRELEETNQELKAAQDKLEAQAEKLRELDEQKSRFFANISHEFRTPLTLVIGPLKDALEGRYGQVPEPLQEALRSMLTSARRLQRLADQLLDLSKLEHGTMELRRQQGDLIAFVQETVNRFAPLAERRDITLRFTSEEQSLSAPFDAEKMEKVVANLLANALKFTPKQGKVWATVRELTDTEQHMAEIVVKDTGPGIAEADLEHIFDRFRQVGEDAGAREGTGVGLTLSKQLVELHGGEIQVESEEGFGSTFIVRLPIDVQANAPLSPKEEAGIPDTGDGADREKRLPVADRREAEETNGPIHDERLSEDGTRDALLLIVEDNADVRAHLRGHLEPDYRIAEADDGAEGLEMAREHRPDLVIADLMMPEMDGYELTEALREEVRLQTVPILILTARASTGDAVEALDKGADDFLTKPFDTEELRARVENLVQTRRQLRQQYSKQMVVAPSDVVVPSGEAPFVEKVLETAEVHLSDSTFGTNRLADALDLSRRHLTRRIKEVTGETPGELLRRLRLERAAQLLQATSQDVSEVASAVGFTSPSHFSKSFKAHFGPSPSEFGENET